MSEPTTLPARLSHLYRSQRVVRSESRTGSKCLLMDCSGGPPGRRLGSRCCSLEQERSGFPGEPRKPRNCTRDRWFMNASTNPPTPFQGELKPGTSFPIKAPGGGDGYPAEECYWTADGKVKDKPTYVLLNGWLHKSGPTFCPDCGRLVVPNNPAPEPDQAPPPTRDEYYKLHPMASMDRAGH